MNFLRWAEVTKSLFVSQLWSIAAPVLGVRFIVCVMRIVVLYIVYRQCTVEVFFSDWEPARQPGEGETSPVSAWRSVFVANEWVKLQMVRTGLLPCWEGSCLEAGTSPGRAAAPPGAACPQRACESASLASRRSRRT